MQSYGDIRHLLLLANFKKMLGRIQVNRRILKAESIHLLRCKQRQFVLGPDLVDHRVSKRKTVGYFSVNETDQP